jgi:hypothetical protein
MHAQDQNPDVGKVAGDLLRHLHSVHPWHRDIEDQYVRVKHGDETESLRTPSRLSHHFKLFELREYETETAADHGVIIGKEYARSRGH